MIWLKNNHAIDILPLDAINGIPSGWPVAGIFITSLKKYQGFSLHSTTILYIALKKIGANVIYYIPDREKDGYGLNEKSLYSLKEQGVKTILTCDNGIAAINEVKKCKEFGMKIVITDHHDLPYEDGDNSKVIMPEADAIINPKRLDCNYFRFLPLLSLCHCGTTSQRQYVNKWGG